MEKMLYLCIRNLKDKHYDNFRPKNQKKLRY